MRYRIGLHLDGRERCDGAYVELFDEDMDLVSIMTLSPNQTSPNVQVTLQTALRELRRQYGMHLELF